MTNEWTVDKLTNIDEEIQKIAFSELGLDPFPLQMEIISSDQMLDMYATHALPIYYQHWSIGKRHLIDETNYKKGRSGLAYEIIANTNPSIAYLMENNSMLMQTLVIAHCYGHSHFFKNNYLYKQWTQPEFIVDYLKFAKNYISKCEEKYGVQAVEETIDAAHALQYNGIDRYKRTIKTQKEIAKQYKERVKYEEENYNSLWSIIDKKKANSHINLSELEKLNAQYKRKILPQPEENLLYFLEKNSPVLQTWQREILRIVRKISQYFYPQFSEKIMNEGFACFTHYYIMNRLYDKGLLSEGDMLEFISSHTNVVLQTMPDLRSEEQKKKDRAKGKPEPYPYSGINVYALGFAMMQDIKRICENPTEEDKQWFPDMAGADWKKVIIDEIIPNYRDESFIRQFLSPKVMRDFRLFAIRSDENEPENYEVLDIHNEKGYRNVRKVFADSYDINTKLPNIQVADVNFMSDRKLKLKHYSINNQILTEDVEDVLIYIEKLWGYSVELESIGIDNELIEIYDTESMRH